MNIIFLTTFLALPMLSMMMFSIWVWVHKAYHWASGIVEVDDVIDALIDASARLLSMLLLLAALLSRVWPH